MANLIQATVYQIDGAPQQPSPITIDFQTSNLIVKESSVSTIPSVQSVIFYYNVVNNQQSVQQFFVGEDVATLLAAANSGGTSQVQVTVLEVNGDPQIPGGVQYTFPANEILVGELINATTGVNAYVQFKGVKYFVSETEATILSAANAGGGSSYSSYVAQFTFNGGTTAPTVQIFDNTIGNVSWSMVGGGSILFGTLTGAFPFSQLWVSASADIDAGNLFYIVSKNQGSDDYIGFRCFNSAFSYVTPSAGSVAFIEIRVYP